MKLIITEKQIKKLVNDIVNVEIDEQDLADMEAGDASPKSGASDTQSGGDGYPEVGKWESGVSVGPANVKEPNSVWPSAGQQPERGKANKLK